MERSASSPDVVILNGTSSAGKSSIAQWLPMTLDRPMVCSGLDVVLMSMPIKLHGHRDGPYFESIADGTVIRLGPTAIEIARAWHQAQATLVRQGFSLVLDEAIVCEQLLESLIDAFKGMRVWLVGVVCDEAVAVAREEARGDRQPGLARGLAELVHRDVEYDLVLDTTAISVQAASECVARLINSADPTAFERVTQLRSASRPT
ncbi:MAG: chloramphenicol phosphotransferase [Actinomycetota bacterium]|jgi:chloramphenicol 3-O phosphotransferase